MTHRSHLGLTSFPISTWISAYGLANDSVQKTLIITNVDLYVIGLDQNIMPIL